MNIIIAVAGPVGGGKSTLTRQLAQALQTNAVLDFDDYEQATLCSVADMARWLANGADFNAINAPGFAADLLALKHGQTIEHPVTQRPIAPQRFIVVEAPLARSQQAVAALIDFVIWIELPLDVALARKLRQMLAGFERLEAEQRLQWLDGYLAGYLQVTRQLLQLQQQHVRPDAQLIVDGLASPQANIQQILQHLSAVYD